MSSIGLSRTTGCWRSAAVLASLLVGVPGCGGGCGSGDLDCDYDQLGQVVCHGDNVLARCETLQTNCEVVCPSPRWFESICPGLCVSSPGGGAYCTESAAPLSDCPDAGDDEAVTCQGSAIVTCRQGYVVRSTACDAGECVFEPGCEPEPFCARSATANPSCAPAAGMDYPSVACDGARAVNCRCGRVVSDEACRGPEFCHVEKGRFQTEFACCTMEATPNPRCGGDAGTAAFCDGAKVIECCGNYARAVAQTCLDDAHCHPGPGYAFCGLDVDPDPRCQEPGARLICDGNLIKECLFGYAVRVFETCEGTCVKACGEVFCARQAQPECPQGATQFCDGDKVTDCHCGYAGKVEESCGAQRCHETDGYAFCALEATTNPRCGQNGMSSFCDGNKVRFCNAGYVYEEQQCQRPCEVVGGIPRCP